MNCQICKRSKYEMEQAFPEFIHICEECWNPYVHVNSITKFEGPHRFLSNFWMIPVTFNGETYQSAEHAYQAAKTYDPDWKDAIKNTETPGLAKKMGRKAPVRGDWEHARFDVMYRILCAKFGRNDLLKKQLLDTGDLFLMEGNTWGDTLWGVCNGRGRNMLGHTLMRVREELRDKEK